MRFPFSLAEFAKPIDFAPYTCVRLYLLFSVAKQLGAVFKYKDFAKLPMRQTTEAQGV